MKNFAYFIIGLFMISSISYAETVSTTRAISVAKNWYQHLNPKQVPVSRTGDRISPVKNVQTEQYKNLDTFYIINMVGGGFVLVSADDAIVPVLGYSFDSEMDQSTINPAAREWLDSYSRQIAEAVSRGLTNTRVKNEWQSLENNVFSKKRSALDVPAMPPLLSTQWNQSSPYNNETPEETLTGCVSTAMAQIMKYHNYPEYGSGQNSYIHDTYGEISANFNIAYQWSNMPDTISDDSNSDDISAVATLIYHAGVSVNMDYGPNESSASMSDAYVSLQNYFGYASSASFIKKADYTNQKWTNILIAELNAFRPMIYSGEDTSGGHSFICDGYQGTEYFHFNWGWGGYSDGYYRISLLDPSDSNYTNDQDAIIGIQPKISYERIAIFSDSFEKTFPSEDLSQIVVTSGNPSPEWTQVSGGSNPTCTPPDGSNMLQFNSSSAPDGSEARLVLESIDLTNVPYPRLTFMMYHESSNISKTTEGIHLQISENATDWMDLDFYPRYTESSGWQTYRVDLTYYSGKIIHIGFLGHSDKGSNIYIDNIEINYAGPTSAMIAETLVSYAGASVAFTDDSFNASSYLWDFGDSTTVVTKDATHIFSNPGIYTITHTVDGISSTSQSIQILPVHTPPYLPDDGGNFESNYLDFGAALLEGKLNIWELGQPGNTISTTSSGLNVWKTDLDSNLQKDNYTSALYTPGFDLTKTGNYYLTFNYRMEIDYSNCPGAAWIEYSIDQGATWQRLGNVIGNPSGTENWYNDDDHDVAPDGICWWHTKAEYTKAIYNLRDFLGTSSICFRFIYKVESNWKGGYDIDGFAIDDFSLEYEPATAAFSAVSFSYVGKTISFTDQSTFPENWSWDFGDAQTSSNQNPSHTYSSPGAYTVSLSINDESSIESKQIIILPVVMPSYLPEDGGNFENDSLHFITETIEGSIKIWEWGIPSNTIANASSGQNVWKTDLDSDLQKDDYTGALYTPGFDLSATGDYYLKFNYRMEIQYRNSPGSAWLEYSVDKGDSWQRLGNVSGNPPGTENWYDRDDHDVAPDGICWWRTKSEYTQAVYNLSDFLGTPAISFRFVFKVAGNWQEGYDIDGFAIDDFTLEYIGPSADFQLPANIIYVDELIQFTDISTFAENWTWHFGNKKFSTDQHATHTYSEPGTYTVTLSINDNASTKSKQIVVLPTIKPPYTPDNGGDFESNPLHFTAAAIDGDINLWELGTPSNTISDTASGITVWKTDLDANIQKADYTNVLYTPNFNFSSSGDYYLKFKYRMEIYYSNSPAAAWLEYSTDQGNTWQKLGKSTGNPAGTENWYDRDDHDVAPDGICWWYNKSKYTQAIYNLSEYAGTQNISFRFVYMVQGNWKGEYNIDGWSIDDFEIEHPTNAPIIRPIPDQTSNKDFTPIILDDYVSDANHAASEITWTASGQENLLVNIDANRVATITIKTSGWTGNESILFTATDPEGLHDTDTAIFTVISEENPPPVLENIPDQTILEGESFGDIDLDQYISDQSTTRNLRSTHPEITWQVTGQAELDISITNRVAKIKTPDENWNGAETVQFTAMDSDGLTSSDLVVLTVLPVNDCPDFDIQEQLTVNNSDGNITISDWATAISPGPDESDQEVEFIVAPNNDDLFQLLPELSDDGHLTFTPKPGMTGTAKIAVFMSDNGGISSGGCDTSDIQEFSITVNQKAIHKVDLKDVIRVLRKISE